MNEPQHSGSGPAIRSRQGSRRRGFGVPDRISLMAVLLVAAAMLLGGGGSSNPRMETVLQVTVAALVLAGLAMAHSGLRRAPHTVWMTAAPLVLLTLAQLVPLPPAVWRALPGRVAERAALDLVGAGADWMPLSMAPAATFAALLAIIAAVAIMLAVARLDVRGRMAVAVAIAVMASASILLGALQLARVGGGTWALYQDVSAGWLIGFQANRNAQADVLQIGMLAVALIGMVRFKGRVAGRAHLLLIAAWLAVLVIGVVLTGSRAGIALLPVTAGFAVAIIWPRLNRKIAGLRLWVAGSALTFASAIYGLTRIGVVQNVIGRFGSDDEGRWDFWIDAVYALDKVWPWGSGIGTFAYAFIAAERLEMVHDRFPRRAHNDWLEWTVEAGLTGWIALALMLLALVWSIRLAWRQWGAANPPDLVQRGQILFGIGVLVIESLHALVDYPTRAMSLAALIAVAAAFVAPVALHVRDSAASR